MRKQREQLIVDGWIWKYSPAYSVYIIEGTASDKAWFVHANNEVEVREKTARLRADGFKPIDSYIALPSTVPEGSQGSFEGAWRVSDGEWKGRTT